MPKYEVYEEIQKGCKEMREAFVRKRQAKGTRNAVVILLSQAEEQYADSERIDDSKLAADQSMIAEAKLSALVDCMKTLVKSRSIFSWLIHAYRNYQERKVLTALEHKCESNGQRQVIVKRHLFGRDKIKSLNAVFNVSEDQRKVYLEIEKGNYDENGYVTLHGEKKLPHEIQDVLDEKKAAEDEEQAKQEYRRKIDAQIEEDGDAFDDERSFIDRDELAEENDVEKEVELPVEND